MSEEAVHVAMFPSAGMGHLTPFLRLAPLLLKNHCKVTLITPLPTVSLAESQLLDQFHSSFPQVNHIPFHLPPPPPPSSSISVDPFFLRVQTLRDSTHLLPPLISSLSPPISIFISDILLLSPLTSITQKLSLPNYILSTSSAAMFSLFSHFPTLAQSLSSPQPEFDDDDVVEVPIPGIPFSPLPYSSIPPFLLDSTSIFRNLAMEDSPKLTNLHGVFANTFEALESHSLEALNGGKVVKNMPPVYAVGPFVPFEFEKEAASPPPLMKWLDDQPIGSVVYVCFGSRTALGREQMREIGDGLMRSGYRFLWVVKDKIVDKEEEVGLDEVLGGELVERMKKRGLVIKEWVDQSEILSHKSVGGFVSHCGWNSITEAALNGVPILGWPQHGDQKINAKLVEINGWGIWNKSWGWGGERVVKGEEIGDAIKEMMKNELLKVKAIELKERGLKAISIGGDCEVTIQKLIQKWKNNVSVNNV